MKNMFFFFFITQPFPEILERLQRIAGDQTLINDDGDAGHTAVAPPAARTELAIVTCDVPSTVDTWVLAPTAMRDAFVLQNAALRRLLAQYSGYELRGRSDGTSMQAVFEDLKKAVEVSRV